MMMTVCLSVCLFVCLSWIQDEHYGDWGWLGGGCIMMMTVCRRSLALGNSQSDPSMSVGSAWGTIPHHYISISVSTTSLRILFFNISVSTTSPRTLYFNICIKHQSHNIIFQYQPQNITSILTSAFLIYFIF